MNIKTVCVLGGSGFVGQHVVHLLAEKGYRVRVLTRKRERAKGLIVLPTVDVIEADVFDPTVLSRHFAGVDAVINLVGVLHESRPGRVDKPQARRGSFHQAHVELPRLALHACAEHGVKRFLHMSALGADPTSRSAYQRSKGVGEALVREASMAHSENERWYLDGPKFVRGMGMQVTIFRPSVIFGRGTPSLTSSPSWYGDSPSSPWPSRTRNSNPCGLRTSPRHSSMPSTTRQRLGRPMIFADPRSIDWRNWSGS